MGLKVNGHEMILSGMVGGEPDGDSFWFADGFSSGHVIQALAEMGPGDVTLRINSGGGIATEGSAIYAALVAHQGNIKVVVEGIAASAASLVAMAGRERIMSPGAVMMIHDPLTITIGDAKAHKKTIDALDALGNAYAGIYAARAAIPLDSARDIMREETWLTGDEAVAQGFATQAEAAANDDEPAFAAFAYGTYRNAPTALVAMANARGWTPRATLAAPAASTKEPTIMSKKTEKAAADAGETAVVETTAVEVAAAVETDPVAVANRRAATISSICNQADHPAWAAGFIEGTLTVEEVQAKLDNSVGIKAAVADARRINPKLSADLAVTFISEGKSVLEARAALLDALVAHQSPEVSAQPPAPVERAAADALVASAGWLRQIEKLNARQG